MRANGPMVKVPNLLGVPAPKYAPPITISVMVRDILAVKRCPLETADNR